MIWLLCAFVISFLNLIYYLKGVFKKQTKPHLFTWLIWSIVTAIAAAAQFHGGGGLGAYLTSWVALSCFTRAIVAIPLGEKNITLSDKFSLLFCGVSIIFWLTSDNPLISLLIVTTIDLVAFYPTFRKSFIMPHQENMISFFIMSFTYLLSLMALENYNILTLLYPLSIAFTGFILCVFLILRRHQLGYKIWS